MGVFAPGVVAVRGIYRFPVPLLVALVCHFGGCFLPDYSDFSGVESSISRNGTSISLYRTYFAHIVTLAICAKKETSTMDYFCFQQEVIDDE